MADMQENKDERFKNPHEDSIVTSNSLGGKKVDADPDVESDRPADEDNPVTQASQKGKKVDADPEAESGKPTSE